MKGSAFEGELAAEIVVPLPEVDLASDQPAVWVAAGLIEKLDKLQLLKQHYGIAAGDDSWPALALALANDFVPGFQVVYNDPLAAVMGLPVKRKAGHQGDGLSPELWGERLIAIVDYSRNALHLTSDKDTCSYILKHFRPDLAKPGQKSRLASATRTLLRRLSEARRQSLGDAKVVRSTSNRP